LPSGTVDGMTIRNDDGLNDRVVDRSDTISLEGSGETKRVAASKEAGRAASNKTLTMTLVAEVAPPVVRKDTLPASIVALKGGFAYVSYNVQGEAYRGGVDVIQVKNGNKAELRSQVLFDDAAVHALHYDG